MDAFLSEDRADDMMKWAKNLEAIGYTIQTLVEAEHKFGDITFEVHGDALGAIIQDYAKAIHETVSEASGVINTFFRERKQGPASLHEELKREWEAFTKRPGPTGTSDLLLINGMIEKVQSFVSDVPLFKEWQKRLEGARERIFETVNKKRNADSRQFGKTEEASAHGQGETEASTTDHE